MRYGIDVHVIGRRKTGTETYLREIVTRLPPFLEEDEHLVLFGHPAAFARLGEAVHHPRVHLVEVVIENLLLQRFWALPAKARSAGVDLLHTQRVHAPRAGCPTIVTIHDIAQTTHPEQFGAAEAWLLHRLMKSSARRAHRVVTVSQYTANEICRHYTVPTEHVIPIHHGVDQEVFHPNGADEARRQLAESYDIDTNFLLFLGTRERRKNIPTLLRAYARLTGEVPQLVLVGKSGNDDANVRKLIESLGLDERVRVLGHAPAEDVPLFLRACRAFLFPSYLEGFGLPVLEAMASGAPVVCSNASSLPEVAADAALSCGPYDELALQAHVQTLLDHPNRSETLVKSGLERASIFDWGGAARRLLAVYRSVVGR